MEFLFNIVWVLLSAALVFRWLRAEVQDGDFQPNCRSNCRLSSRLGWKTRAVALVLIIFVLLPAVSLTDDLQSNVKIAEGEHLARRLENLVNGDLQAIEASLVPVMAIAIPPLLTSTQRIVCEEAEKREQAGLQQRLDNRPPPALDLL